MSNDPTSHDGPRSAATRLRAMCINADDAELGAISRTALDIATEVDAAGLPRQRAVWIAFAMLAEAELVRREAVYGSALDEGIAG